MNFKEIGYAFRLHKPVLLRFLGRMVGRSEAEDLLQETFERALKASSTYRNEAAVKNWLFRIASNLAIDFLRKDKRQSKVATDIYKISVKDLEISDAFIDIIDERPWNMPLETANRKEMLDCIAKFINELQPHFKTMILLREIDNLPISDIAEILEISPENVRVRIFRSHQILKKALIKGCHVYQVREGNYICDPK